MHDSMKLLIIVMLLLFILAIISGSPKEKEQFYFNITTPSTSITIPGQPSLTQEEDMQLPSYHIVQEENSQYDTSGQTSITFIEPFDTIEAFSSI